MKLVRYGVKGKEKPGIIDSDGNIRDLSKKVSDIDGKRILNLWSLAESRLSAS